MTAVAPNLREAQLAGELAAAMVDLLPGKPHPFADQDLSFPGAAHAAGVGARWRGGSKMPALTQLLADTLEHERPRFCRLVLEIVRRATTYRLAKGPVTREEIDHINGVVGRIGFKIPELHDRAYLESLPRETSAAPGNAPVGTAPSASPSPARLAQLAADLLALSALQPTPRGLGFERFLNALFRACGLEPREPFSLRGEQIDGSFVLDQDLYLLEAKWTNSPIGHSELLAFAGKVTAKATWTRGLFVSFGGFTTEGLDAFARGRPTAIICMDGLDLHHVLAGHLDLPEVLRRKARRAAETTRAHVPVRELFPQVT